MTTYDQLRVKHNRLAKMIFENGWHYDIIWSRCENNNMRFAKRLRQKRLKDIWFTCVDCGVNTHDINEYYMVRDEIWNLVGAGGRMLCIGCLEKKLGRQLIRDDFSYAPINSPNRAFDKSERLKDRLGLL